ncbi:MAG: HAMP domain-containing histidine kinase [Oscillospiraceae bacterium]|nr:HAMP domain-containing histidine kinase [Oscillospiraceae bacterium]
MKKSRRLSLALALMLFLTVMMWLAIMLLGGFLFLLRATGLFDIVEVTRIHRLIPFIGVLFVNFLIAAALTVVFSKRALMPLRKIIKATKQVAEGDFTVKVDAGRGINEFSELAGSFNKMTYELSSIETLRSDFINNFSHEFKTPIVSIRGFAKLLKDGSLSDGERKEYLEIILAESERLAALSTNVLNLSKYESLEIVTEKEPFRVDEQIRRAVVMTEPRWSAKNLDVDIEMEEVTYNGSADLTQQIWLNLIDNAVKYSVEGGIITIRLAHRNNGLRFIIRDSGIGMDEPMKTRIFDKFYQGDASRTKAGNGLGLTIVKRITELCGGSIAVESEPGKGSTFIVTLPM